MLIVNINYKEALIARTGWITDSFYISFLDKSNIFLKALGSHEGSALKISEAKFSNLNIEDGKVNFILS